MRYLGSKEEFDCERQRKLVKFDTLEGYEENEKSQKTIAITDCCCEK